MNYKISPDLYDECHFMVSDYKDEIMLATIGDALLWKEVSAPGINMGTSLTSDNYVEIILKKSFSKTHSNLMQKLEIDNQLVFLPEYIQDSHLVHSGPYNLY